MGEQGRERRRQRVPRLACHTYHTRGRRGCSNKYETPLARLEDLVLTAIEEDLFAPAIVNAAIARAMDLVPAHDNQVQTSAADTRGDVRRPDPVDDARNIRGNLLSTGGVRPQQD